MVEYISARVQLVDVFGHSPGDPCPGENCDGTIEKIVAIWYEDSFMANAVCDTCDESWALIEESTPTDVLESEANGGRKA